MGTKRSIVIWLIICLIMVIAMAGIGAITRLTESGLSIMEWALFRGVLPPLNAEGWERLFALYQNTGEFKVDNSDMDLAAFKTIFWWEWIHRFWGRMIGLVYALPLAYFWLRGQLPTWFKPHGILLLILGGLQGAIGWFMVASGFDDGLTDVSHFRLAAHLVMALLLALYLALMIFRFWPLKRSSGSFLLLFAWWLLGIAMLVLIVLGAFVAGKNAGLIYNEWPLMGGEFVPADYWLNTGFFSSILESDAAIQFNHRWFAAAVLLFGLLLVAVTYRVQTGMRRLLVLFAVLLTLQFLLGVLTLLTGVNIALATAHQVNAFALSCVLLAVIYRQRWRAI